MTILEKVRQAFPTMPMNNRENIPMYHICPYMLGFKTQYCSEYKTCNECWNREVRSSDDE